ncbi:MAG: 50S ribosomal protein L18 [Candidatus Diapherotrites archaeon]|nr:50S ribosomal protein L18 [Candidatus Diapherotrites archaeon]
MTSTFLTKFRRRIEQKTNYKKRLALLKSKTDRVVIRRTNSQVIVQLVKFEPSGDRTLCSAVSNELRKMGWKSSAKNMPACYLTGFLCGTKAKKAGASTAILDMGLHTPVHGGRIFAALKGFVDAGIKVPLEEDVLPKEDRVFGKHLQKPMPEFEKVLSEIKSKAGEQ